MSYTTQNGTSATYSKLQQLGKRLVKMHCESLLGNKAFHKKQSLLKRYKRCLQKLISTRHPLAKAAMAAGFSLLLCIEGKAQCDQFVNAEIANPLKRAELNFVPRRPAFVDIDNDGDYDCYVLNADGGAYWEPTLLRNKGTKEFPVFEVDPSGGFPDSVVHNFYNPLDGPLFVDIDGDGDYDCFLSQYAGAIGITEYFKNVGDKTNPVFEHQPKELNPLGFLGGLYGLNFNLVDIDADGDYDLYKASFYFNSFYRNLGTKTDPDFVFEKGNNRSGLPNQLFAHTIYIDWNKDGLIDRIKTDAGIPFRHNTFYKNDGTLLKPEFSKDLANGPHFRKGFDLYALVDLNNDGFQEAFSLNGGYALSSPVASITATDQGESIKLDAYPKGAQAYQWIKNGKDIPGATADNYMVSGQRGAEFTVRVTDVCGNGISLPYTRKKNTTDAQVSKVIPVQNISLRLYPNPFTSECILRWSNDTETKLLVKITDATGKLVETITTGSKEIYMGKALKPGIYFLQAIKDNEVIYRQKLVKQ